MRVLGVGIDWVSHLRRLAQAQDGGNEQHGLGRELVGHLALQLPQPQQQLCQGACACARASIQDVASAASWKGSNPCSSLI